MKRVVIAMAAILGAASGVTNVSADERYVGVQNVEDEVVVTNDYVDFFFNGFTMKVPQGMPVTMEGNEAVVKSPDGTFGVSVKVEKDSKASGIGAYELCKRVVTDLHLHEAKLTKVKINGMEGASVEGEIEGMGVGVEILDAGKSYLKVIAIYDGKHFNDARTVLMSIEKN